MSKNCFFILSLLTVFVTFSSISAMDVAAPSAPDTPQPQRVRLSNADVFIGPGDAPLRINLANAVYNEESTEELEHQIAVNPGIVHLVTPGGEYTLLHLTAAFGNVNATEVLIRAGARIDAYDSNQRAPLHFAALHGHNSTVAALLAHGANIHIKAHPGFLGKTALHYAAQGGFVDVMRTLIRHFRRHGIPHPNETRAHAVRWFVNIQDNIEYTPLCDAIQEKHLPAAIYLLNHGASPGVTTLNGPTIIALAVMLEFPTIIPYLIQFSSNRQEFLESAIAAGNLPESALQDFHADAAQPEVQEIPEIDDAEEPSGRCSCWPCFRRSSHRSSRSHTYNQRIHPAE